MIMLEDCDYLELIVSKNKKQNPNEVTILIYYTVGFQSPL